MLIIINTYFPYYESVPNGQSRPDPAFVEAIFGGTHIWETDAIRVCPPASKPPSTPALETAYLATTLDGSRHVCGYRSPGGRAYCNCNQFQQTGKRCAGLWALATLDVAGRVSKYERDVTAESNLLTDRSSGDVSAGTDHEEIISVFARHNILENPRACLIESGLDPTDALNYEALRELTPTSPIGRRYRTGHRDDEAEEGTLAESVGESLAKIHTNGRPPKTRPFRLSRKAKKSTLGPRKDELEASDRPTGFVNPGTDCFALSLFQLLTRQPEWRSVFGAFAAGTGRTSPVAQLLDRFQRCVDEGIVETFAELKDVLTGRSPSVFLYMTDISAESKLITPELSGQHDPTETLASMIDHFDTLAKASIHNDIFAAFIERTLSCSQGHIHRVERNPNGESVLYAYPDGMAHEENPGTRRLLQNTLFEQDAPNKPCPTCRETAAVEPVSRFARLGKLLAIQVVWNIDQTSRDIDSRPTKVALHYFDISLKVDLTGLFSRQKDGTQPNVAATLGGLLCKQGDRIEGGHYVAYIHHEDRWWRMDDHRAIEVRSVGDAFDEGRYPVFLLYRVAGSVSGPSPELRKHSPSSKRTPQTSTKRCSTESTRSPMDDGTFLSLKIALWFFS